MFGELSRKVSTQLSMLDTVLGQQSPGLNRLISQQHLAPNPVPQSPGGPRDEGMPHAMDACRISASTSPIFRTTSERCPSPGK